METKKTNTRYIYAESPKGGVARIPEEAYEDWIKGQEELVITKDIKEANQETKNWLISFLQKIDNN